MKQPVLMGDLENERNIVLSMPMVLPAEDAAKRLSDLLSAYEGDKSALLLGYWDYGGEIVVTAPAK